MKSRFLPFRRIKLFSSLHPELTCFGSGEKEWRSGTALEICRPILLLKHVLAHKAEMVAAHFQATLEPFSNFRINQEVKQANNSPRIYVSNQLKCWVSPPQKVFHIFTAMLPKWVSTALLYKAHIVKTRPLQTFYPQPHPRKGSIRSLNSWQNTHFQLPTQHTNSSQLALN